MRYVNSFFKLTICFLFGSCTTKNKYFVDEKEEKAKWYYYCYSTNLSLYKGNIELNSLETDVKKIAVSKNSSDTIKYIFGFIYQNDTVAFCNSKPLDLVGVRVIKDSFYLPIYSHAGIPIDTTPIPETQILSFMRNSKIEFEEKIKNQKNLSRWLKTNYRKYQ
jgi:hypothetical protein